MRPIQPGPHNRFPSPWALADDEVEAPMVIDLRDAEIEQDLDLRCPACQSHAMEAAITPGGIRYGYCLHCDRVWEASDGRLKLVVNARVRTRKE